MSALEKHYTVKELVLLLGWSKQRVSRHFKHHPLTVRDGWRFFIPQSAVDQVLARMRNNHPPTPARRGRPWPSVG